MSIFMKRILLYFFPGKFPTKKSFCLNFNAARRIFTVVDFEQLKTKRAGGKNELNIYQRRVSETA